MFSPPRFVNHAIYFGCFSPNPTNETRLPTTKLLNDIISTFGSYEAFKEQFTQEAVSLFGSGMSLNYRTQPNYRTVLLYIYIIY